MFGSTEYDNECSGCIYNEMQDSEQGIKMILDVCLCCKRAMKPEYKDQYKDLYISKEVNANE